VRINVANVKRTDGISEGRREGGRYRSWVEVPKEGGPERLALRVHGIN